MEIMIIQLDFMKIIMIIELDVMEIMIIQLDVMKIIMVIQLVIN